MGRFIENKMLHEVNAYIPIVENKTCKSFVSNDAAEHGDCVRLCTGEKDLYQKNLYQKDLYQKDLYQKDLYQKKRVGLSLT